MNEPRAASTPLPDLRGTLHTLRWNSAVHYASDGQRYAWLMDGALTVASTGAPGQGSTFCLEVPVGLATHADTATVQPPIRQRALGLAPGQPVYRLLVVEDRAEGRRLLTNLLRPPGTSMQLDLTGVAAWWIKKVRATAVAANATQVSELADEVAGEWPTLAAALRKWVDEFNYAAILATVEGM